MPTWTLVRQDNGRQQQVTSKMNPDDLSVQQIITQTILAKTSSLTATVVDALSADDGTLAVPTLGGYYSVAGFEWFLCTSVFPRQVGPGAFEVQCEYYRKIAFKPSGKDKWAANISFSGVKYIEKAHRDFYGRALLNSAGVSFDPGRNRTYQDERMDVSFKTTTIPDFRLYRSQVNSAVITFNIAGVSRTYQPRQLMFDDGTMSTSVTLGDGTTGGTPPTPVWDVKMSFTSRTVGANGGVDGYVDRILDEGKEFLSPAGQAIGGGKNDAGLSYADLLTALANPVVYSAGATKVTKVTDVNSNFVDSPLPLDGTGQVLGPAGTPVFMAFAVEGQTDLNPLFAGF